MLLSQIQGQVHVLEVFADSEDATVENI